MKIAVAGGTGAVGRHVVDVVRERGHEPVVLARSTGADLITGSGLADRLDGVSSVVDVTSIAAQSGATSTRFFERVTENLLAAERRAGVGHHLALSIVGSDLAPHGYYAGKAAQERAVEQGAVPWTILRATQFHEFAPQILGRMRTGPLALIPVMRCQPVAAREVASRLVDLAAGVPAGHAVDLAGPREESMVDMVRRYVSATGGRSALLAIPVPGAFGKALRDGTLLAGTEAQRGTQTFAQWLDELGAGRESRRR
ncbi:SDR family oxidoreductase [Amnibacterium flavum]|nr:NAD(P)H-binding protein [Amnibacterium flavum]